MPKKIPLRTLRDIGWMHWDPIGIISDRHHCEDEYDTYLIRAMSMFVQNATIDDVAKYLVDIEANYIGLKTVDETRAKRAAEEILHAVEEWQSFR